MNQFKPNLIRSAVVLVVAFVASLLRWGFPPSEGWAKFCGAMVFIGIQIPIWFATCRSRDKRS